MSSVNHQLMPGRQADGYAGTPLPPLSVLLQLASLVLVLAVEMGKGYLAACITNTKERFVTYPRAGEATQPRAFADRIKKE